VDVDTLTLRAANRATLCRQLLLDRAELAPIEAVEQLAGLQSQAPLAPYIGLWTRLRDFAAEALSVLTEQRQVVRLPLMRTTVHLVSARDAIGWYPLFSALHIAAFRANFARGVDGVDEKAIVEQAELLLLQQPRTRVELGRLLAQCWPDADQVALGYAATQGRAVCQVPPRGVWGKGGQPAWTQVETWLGRPLRAVPVDDLVLRYLGAFGPATAADVQVWSGLRRLAEVLERLPVRTFRGESGQLLYDLPDAPRPPSDLPAPPRFLPAYDNLLLSYKDRTRVIPDVRLVPLPPGNGATVGTFLVDGIWRGTWQIRNHRLHVQPFDRLRPQVRDGVLAEAVGLLTFVEPGSSPDVVVDDPA
jgi:hypothetical protein